MNRYTIANRTRLPMAGLLIAGLLLVSEVALASQYPLVPAQPAPAAQSPASPAPPPSAAISQAPAATIPVQSQESGPIAPGSELSLRKAIRIALRYYPRLRESESQSAAARQEVGVARAALGPQVYGVSQYLRTTENGIGNSSYYDPFGLFPRATGSNHNQPSGDFSQNWDTENNYMGGLAVQQFLFDFGRHRGYVAQRRFEAAAAGNETRMAELNLIFEVSQRYFNLLRDRQLVHVYEKAVEERQFHLHEAQVKAQAGLRPQLDVYVTRAEVERAQLHLVDARNAVAEAKVALDNAMGLSGTAPNYHLAQVLTYSPIEAKLASLMQTAFEKRPDLQMLEERARAMGAVITQYRSDYFPTVTAVGGYSAIGTGLPAANNFNAGIVITWPIFNSFATTHEVERARLKQQATQQAIEVLRQRVILQVKTAFLDWQASLDRIRRAQKVLAASAAELELANTRYKTGLSDIVELEDAERHYTDDDAGYADSLYSYSLAKAAVEEVTGQSLSHL